MSLYARRCMNKASFYFFYLKLPTFCIFAFASVLVVLTCYRKFFIYAKILFPSSSTCRPTHPRPFLDRPQSVAMGPCVAIVFQVHLGIATDFCGMAVFGVKGNCGSGGPRRDFGWHYFRDEIGLQLQHGCVARHFRRPLGWSLDAWRRGGLYPWQPNLYA